MEVFIYLYFIAHFLYTYPIFSYLLAIGLFLLQLNICLRTEKTSRKAILPILCSIVGIFWLLGRVGAFGVSAGCTVSMFYDASVQGTVPVILSLAAVFLAWGLSGKLSVQK